MFEESGPVLHHEVRDSPLMTLHKGISYSPYAIDKINEMLNDRIDHIAFTYNIIEHGTSIRKSTKNMKRNKQKNKKLCLFAETNLFSQIINAIALQTS